MIVRVILLRMQAAPALSLVCDLAAQALLAGDRLQMTFVRSSVLAMNLTLRVITLLPTWTLLDRIVGLHLRPFEVLPPLEGTTMILVLDSQVPQAPYATMIATGTSQREMVTPDTRMTVVNPYRR